MVEIEVDNQFDKEYKPEYLITKSIDLNTFKTNAENCYPLKNIFALIGCKTQEEIAEQINDIAGNKTAIRRLENKLKTAKKLAELEIDSIKSLGIYNVKIKLYVGVSTSIKLNVVAE